MKLLNRGLALAVVGAGLAALPTIGVQAAPAAQADTNGVAAMADRADGTVAVTREEATRKVGFIRVKGEGDLLPGVEGDSLAAARDKVDAYLDRYATNFGARPGELVRSGVTKSAAGWTVTYTQSYRGVDVFGSMLRAQVDEQGDLTAVNGYAAPDLSLSVDPRIGAGDAGKRAVGLVREDPPAHDGETADLTGIAPQGTELVVYRMGATRGEAGDAVLAWKTEVTNEKNVRDVVFIDAQTGKALNRWSLVHDALSRELYEATGTAQAPVLTRVWKEGDAFPGGLNADQQNLVNSAGESYWMFENTFGRDSYDGNGAIMRTVNNDPRISCPNANWNGVTTNYCNGVTSDDVVSHEWGHAYTEYTSGLIYQYQSGALNESYSDVWGETLDLINGREDEDEEYTTKREVGDCDVTAPPGLDMAITAPANLAGPCVAVAATGAKPFTTTATTAQVVRATDAANADGPSTTDGCSAFSNAAAVATRWAYVDRGTCPFATKVANAKAAGATGIVIGNNNVDPPAGFTGDPALYGVMVSQADGAKFKSTADPVTVSVTAEDVSTRPDTTRWLMGEKSTAFGGAIRDMWNPTCYGDPGKVTDAEYKCDPTGADAGGVHSNSGVPNHAYALVVDGGEFNGQTVTGLGLDKAAAIWWRAQTAYLTPQSNFIDAANAFEQSCVDLVGAPINKLTTEPNATPESATPIAAGDCASVQAATAATEMRTEPVKCDFKALLAKDAPATCGDGFTEDVLWSEDFEDGLTGWAASKEVVFAGGINEPWQSVASAPAGTGAAHPSKVAFGPAPDEGQCVNGAGDFSSRDSITGPVVQLPASLRSAKLTFEHYVATEIGYDGGNVKMSINGGPFTAVPAAAFLYNAPTTLTGPATNTNPLAGQPGFTGTDGGQTKGSWGQSQVDLAAAGAKPNDTVQVRFDIGRDGCGGNEGWYVDNVKIVDCKLVTRTTAVHQPEPSTFGTASTAEVTVARDGSVGGAPEGTVTVTDAAGKTLGSATLAGGKASVALPADLPVGANKLTATFSGDGTLAKSSATFTATVKAAPLPGKAESTTTAKVKPEKPRHKQDFRVVVKVEADGTTPTGKVEVRIDGTKVGTARLDDGRLVLKVKKNLKVGSHKLVAKYLGSDTVGTSRDKLTFKVVRR
ncbi:Zn-dependent metalloprotease [Nocardioides cavernae]|uniref:Zn-dependent metalloprotease n=1 Tax=Nocardioides cavernae TaxID=1921566 RepID=A0A7Y9H6N8_9ACTN|nr:M4 family metallopeptidase [Nocardioides cavernae]NYE38703.1 Zn-dependent metalloprotease [Nocardioides cavernae]